MKIRISLSKKNNNDGGIFLRLREGGGTRDLLVLGIGGRKLRKSVDRKERRRNGGGECHHNEEISVPTFLFFSFFFLLQLAFSKHCQFIIFTHPFHK